MTWLSTLAALSVASWLYLLLGRDGFWRARPLIEREASPQPARWPPVLAVVPARNEAAHVGTALTSLLEQDYPGPFTITLVDDHSDDGTGAIARRLGHGQARRLDVIEAGPLPPGWTGKLWALSEGMRHGQAHAEPDYLLLTDADIAHDPNNLARLVAKAEAGRLELASLMVRLHCSSFWERFLIPPFVFFFQKLYPFAAVNDPRRPVAAAAGGCMLVRRRALAEAGGLEAIRDRLIDDVALAQAIKRRPGGGSIWLGLTAATRSLRHYDRLTELWAMVARTADTQLRHSLLLLAATVTGMAILYLLPPLVAIAGAVAGDPLPASLGALAWLCLSVAYRPTVRLYGLAPWWITTLPLAAMMYVAMTVASAVQHRRGTGGRWKDRLPSPAN